MPTGGEAFVAALEDLGVEVAFGLPGVHNLAAWTGFLGSQVRLVGVRHEQTAAYAADGYARATGRLGVAVTTTGPGASNAVTGCGEAWAAGSPVLVVATDIPTTLRREGEYRGVLHETVDQAGFFRPVTKAVVRVERAEDLHAQTMRAGRLAMTHPRRPVYLEIPTDLLSASVDEPDRGPWAWTQEAYMPDVAAALEVLAQARRPLLWVGGGASASGEQDLSAAGVGSRPAAPTPQGAAALVTALAERLGAPVLCSYGGRGLLPPDHPLLVQAPPHVPAGGAAWDGCDAVVVLGSDLDFMNTQGFRHPERPTVVVDLDPGRVQLPAPPAAVVRFDVAGACAALLEALPPREPWFTPEPDRTREDHPAEAAFLAAVEAALPADAVVVADMCVAGYWYGGFGRVGSPRGLAYPVGWGTLGFGFPAALGTALSGRPTVALVGDGGFLFACGELATAAQEQIPLTVVLVDDGGYGMLAYDFTRHGDTPVGCDLEPPDFVALARAFRVDAREVAVPDLAAAVAAGIAAGRPDPARGQGRVHPAAEHLAPLVPGGRTRLVSMALGESA